jgi:membrane-bound inhibitor of C-type lysozyme
VESRLASLSASIFRAAIAAVLAIGAALIGMAFAQAPSATQSPKAKSPEPSTIRAVFNCDAGKTVAAVFHDGTRHNVRLSLSDGRKLKLPQALSGSGARYANGDESFVFWNKGDTAFIEETGKTTYSGCIAKK